MRAVFSGSLISFSFLAFFAGISAAESPAGPRNLPGGLSALPPIACSASWSVLECQGWSVGDICSDLSGANPDATEEARCVPFGGAGTDENGEPYCDCQSNKLLWNVET